MAVLLVLLAVPVLLARPPNIVLVLADDMGAVQCTVGEM
jgi:hypothetical protein